MNKDTFIKLISSYTKEELNGYIKQNGKKKKPRKMLIYLNTRK